MGFIHGETGEQGPRISEFLFRICNTCMKQGISIVNKEDPGFDNYYLNFEAALFLRSLGLATYFQCEVDFTRIFVREKVEPNARKCCICSANF